MATMTAPVTDTKRIPGGSFLITDAVPADCFFPEDFTDEHKQIAETTANFAINEIMPASAQIEAKDFSVTRRLLKEAADLGLTAVDIPEEYGGLEMDKASSSIVAENISKQASFSVSFSAHVGIGTMPLVWYGTKEQKKKYLPKIASGEIICAYALSESTSGSDAVNARTRAVLSADGKTYTLNGEKMWISNAGFADLFTVFAKCAIPDGPDAGKERLTAFLIERGTPGFTQGKEEHKLGIRGSSTCPLILTDCVIPAANLLGEVGKGHHIAFNILNVGRYKLGNAAVGGGRMALNNGIRYAIDRKAFGKSISEFGLIQEKIANCATGVFVGASRLLSHCRPDRQSARGCRQERHQGDSEAHRGVCGRMQHRQGLGERDARHGRRRGAADLCRLRLRRGVSGRARLPRRPHQPHLRGHERDQSPDHHRLADEVCDERQAAP